MRMNLFLYSYKDSRPVADARWRLLLDNINLSTPEIIIDLADNTNDLLGLSDARILVIE